MDGCLKSFEDNKLVAIIRSSTFEVAEQMLKAAAAGGFKVFEISMQTPQALKLLETFSKKECLAGAGSITDGEMAQRAINSGAKFLASDYTDHDIINVARNNDSFVISGAMTPTEAFNAYQWGADIVRVYPAALIGGPDFLKALKGPLPFIKFMAQGGVSLENCTEYLKHVTAVGLGKGLFDKALVRADQWSEITELAKKFTQKLDMLKVAK